VGIREAADEATVRHVIAQAAYLGALLSERGVPTVVPVGAHAVFLDAKRILPHLPQTEFPAQSLAAALYVAGGVRSMERGIVSGQHGHAPYDGLELVRLTLPRRVYTQEHLAYVAEVVEAVCQRADEIPGLAFTYEPENLRFFLGRFEPVSPFPDLAGADERRIEPALA
jgi:tyrosine phenol-lyase